MESQGEGYDEENDYDGEFQEGHGDVGEHDDVDPEEGQLAHVGEEVEPREEEAEGAELPLPARPEARALVAVVEVDHEEERRAVQRPLHKVLEAKIGQANLKLASRYVRQIP